MKYISIEEFRNLGYLQELNRQFLHPLGLALEIVEHDDGTLTMGGIQDHRDGEISYNISEENELDSEITKVRKQKALYISDQKKLRAPKRNEKEFETIFSFVQRINIDINI